MDPAAAVPSVKVVGPCKAGKTTLVTSLRALGIPASAAAQEHSGVPDLWRRFSPAQILVFLDVDVDQQRRRSGRSDWTEEILAEQQRRLADARGHAQLYVDTAGLTAQEVLDRVLAYLRQRPAAD